MHNELGQAGLVQALIVNPSWATKAL